MTLLKYVANVRVSNVDKKSYQGERRVRLCNYTDVYNGDVLTGFSNEYMWATASVNQIQAFRLHPGDSLLTKDSETADDIGVSAFVSETSEDLVCGYHLAVVRPHLDIVDPKFLFWVLRSSRLRSQMSVSATGVTRFGRRTEALLNLSFDLPRLEESAPDRGLP